MTDQENLDTPIPEVPDEPGKQPADKTDRFKKDIERAEKRGATRLLKELGLNSVEELRAKINPQTPAADDGLKGELETVKAQLAKLNEIAEKSQQEAESLKAQRRQDTLLATLKATVKGLRLKDTVAEDIVGWATLSRRDLSKLLDADLQPNTAEIEALVNDARTARPEWFKTVGIGSPSTMMGKPPTESEATKKAKEAGSLNTRRLIKRGF